MPSAWVCALGVACSFAVACSLAVEDYEPALVERETLAEEPPANMPGCDAGLECCELVPCPVGGECLSGACATAPAPVVPTEPPDAGACRGSDCVAPPPVVLAPSCDDGALNGDEVDVDCGGGCERRCLADQACSTSADCAEGFYCPEANPTCTAVSCSDGVLNGSELSEDCGGGTCPGCADGAPCATAADCTSGVCGEDATCSPPSCTDGVVNRDETAEDCGGTCPAECSPGQACAEPEDCTSGVCAAAGCDEGVALCCQVPACNDRVLNGNETALDCGGACDLCENGSLCSDDAECESTLCQNGRCQALPSCDDEDQNADETDVDCGGGTCAPCDDGASCIEAIDCESNSCEDGTCISCGDGDQNGLETDLDCGGPACPGCALGGRCNSNDDCGGTLCVAGLCN